MRAVLPLARRIHMAAAASMRPALEPPASAIYARVAIKKRRPPPDGSFVFVETQQQPGGHKQYGVPLATPATGGVSDWAPLVHADRAVAGQRPIGVMPLHVPAAAAVPHGHSEYKAVSVCVSGVVSVRFEKGQLDKRDEARAGSFIGLDTTGGPGPKWAVAQARTESAVAMVLECWALDEDFGDFRVLLLP